MEKRSGVVPHTADLAGSKSPCDMDNIRQQKPRIRVGLELPATLNPPPATQRREPELPEGRQGGSGC